MQENSIPSPSVLRTGIHALILLLLILQTACSSGDEEGNETLAWVRIDVPVEGYTTGSDTVVVEGNAAMRDGSYPQTVYIYSNYGSWVADQSVICIVACIAAFRAHIPLGLGENTITVTMADGSDQVRVIRSNQVVVRGRITVDSLDGPGAGDLPVTLSGSSGTITARSDETGYFQFSNIGAGDYTLTPEQPTAPQSSGCYNFSPTSRSVNVPANDGSDINNQNFVSNTVQSCYYIRGQVTYAINPDIGVQNEQMTLTDSIGNTLVRYTNNNGYYTFYNLVPGNYVITPAGYTVTSCTLYTPGSRAITINDSNVVLQNFSKNN